MNKMYLKLFYLKCKIYIHSLIKKKYDFDRYDIKWKRLEKYAIQFNYNVNLVETGTYYGLTVEHCYDFFDKIYTIELNHKLYEFNKIRFKDQLKINLLEGDSGQVLNKILSKGVLGKNCVFWLDGHYSDKETSIALKTSPIIEELKDIFSFVSIINNWIILIDDRRLFDGIDYPTLEEIELLANSNNYKTIYDDDCIVLIPVK